MVPTTREALILAGGLGTRLRTVVSDRPKPLAEVAGRPFITFLLDQLLRSGFQRAVLCVGHLGEYVPLVLGENYGALELLYSFEQTALGTAGALRNAAGLVREQNVVAMNGDSFCDLDLRMLEQMHRTYDARATVSVLHTSDRGRAGALTVDPTGRVSRFENRPSDPAPGLINAGIYMLRRDVLNAIPPNRAISLEEETFPDLAARRELFAWQVEARFIDIGTPESHQAAQSFFDRVTE
jgi:D-glycero-alpha-D-manno-heptose 1-phosphate guanylyltransferase